MLEQIIKRGNALTNNVWFIADILTKYVKRDISDEPKILHEVNGTILIKENLVVTIFLKLSRMNGGREIFVKCL